jgi:hypothetical protein
MSENALIINDVDSTLANMTRQALGFALDETKAMAQQVDEPIPDGKIIRVIVEIVDAA